MLVKLPTYSHKQVIIHMVAQLNVSSIRATLVQASALAVGKIQLFINNTRTIIIAGNPIQPGRNAHVHARYYYVATLRGIYL